MKKLLTWLLCLMMLVSAVPALAYTTGTYTGTGTGMLDKIITDQSDTLDTAAGFLEFTNFEKRKSQRQSLIGNYNYFMVCVDHIFNAYLLYAYKFITFCQFC